MMKSKPIFFRNKDRKPIAFVERNPWGRWWVHRIDERGAVFNLGVEFFPSEVKEIRAATLTVQGYPTYAAFWRPLIMRLRPAPQLNNVR